ncbi:MAG: beta-ketoacyl-ACP synthase III, partial [Peptostreptococcaceae bacterium]
MNTKAGIVGVGSYLPEKVISNFDFEKIMDTSDEWIRTRTGISERRIVDKNEATSDLATKAAIKAIDDANLTPQDIDLIIVATITPDMVFPSTACLVQSNIKATKAVCFDLEAACSGFIYGITIAKQFIETNTYKHVLVIGSEAMSRILDYEDRSTSILFGDGAGAVVMGPVDEGGVLSTNLGSDGNGKDYLNIPAGGSKQPASEETVKNRLHYVKMAGNDVFKFAVRIMQDASIKCIESANLDIQDIDYLIPHQANIRIIEAS